MALYPQQVVLTGAWGVDPRTQSRQISFDGTKGNSKILQMYRIGAFGFILLSDDTLLNYQRLGGSTTAGALSGATSGDFVGSWLEPGAPPGGGVQYTVTRCIYTKDTASGVCTIFCVLQYVTGVPP